MGQGGREIVEEEEEKEEEVEEVEKPQTAGAYDVRRSLEKLGDSQVSSVGSVCLRSWVTCALVAEPPHPRSQATASIDRSEAGRRFDVDECQVHNGGCQHKCINTRASFYCECNPGSRLHVDARTCLRHRPLLCRQQRRVRALLRPAVVRHFRCRCRTNYAVAEDGKHCKHIDECETPQANCAHGCHNTLGSYACVCLTAYELGADGSSATTWTSAAEQQSCCEQDCTNYPGATSATAPLGTASTPTGAAVTMWTECLATNAAGDHTCENNAGSFQCFCRRSFRLDEDRRSCVRE
ncbi:hypothetical protein CRUP_003371 [Coryphaenoides rupestris]|nr:hypothetical protein CRUP_003371 [Coryphaenoides rupestris]